MKRIAAQLAAVIPLLVLHGALGFLALIAYVAVTAGVSIADTAKTRTTEARLNAHVAATAPAVNFVANGGTVGGNVTVNGTHTITGDLFANGPNTFVGGLTVSGSAAVAGNHTVSGTSSGFNVVATNGVTAGNALEINGGLSMPNGSPGAVGSPPSGTGGPAAYAGNFFAGSGASTWAIGVTNAINQIHSILSANQITN